MDTDSNQESNSILKELRNVDWSLLPDEVGKVLADNCKILRGRLPLIDSEEKHGILTIENSRFDKVLIVDETPFLVDIESTESTYAIPITEEMAIISPTNPDIAVVFALAPDKDDENIYGSRIVIRKCGTAQNESKKFISKKVIDSKKLEKAQNLRRLNMKFNSNLDGVFDREIEISKLENEAIEIVSRDCESISPTMDSYTQIEVEFFDLSFKVLGVDNSLLVIQPAKSFQIQTFATQ